MLDRVATIMDLREIARRKLPGPIFDYMDGAAFNELTLRANTRDFDAIRFRLRTLRDVTNRNLATTLAGQPASMPAAISPIGIGGVIHGGAGEIQAARGAKAAGIPYTLGMLSIATIEEVYADSGPFWFQICMLKDRGAVKSLVDRAIEAQSPVLVMTVTWAASGVQSRMVRHGIPIPPQVTLRAIRKFAGHPAWLKRTLLGKPVGFNNFEGLVKDPSDLTQISDMLDSSTTWKDLEWVRSIWPGKLVIKGVNSREDGRLAMEHGADAVSVSNHGGNQLDGAASTIAMLPEVVEGVAGRGEVFLDSGVRSGQDILKCLAYGARGVLLGRAHLYGLGANGEKGVAQALEIIRYELDSSLGLTGLRDVHDASAEILFP